MQHEQPSEVNSVNVIPSMTSIEDEGEQDTETLDETLWPLMPYFGARAATHQDGVVMFGRIAAVDQTVVKHEILYVLLYEDGDVEHLTESAAAAAVGLALANVPEVAPPLRQLGRREADAHLGGRALARRAANAHNDNEEVIPP